jgi:hypothetical protein
MRTRDVTAQEARRFTDEAAPILRHALVTALLFVCLFVFGDAIRELHRLLPQHTSMLAALDVVDLSLSLALFIMFALYTTTILAIRLWAGVRRELRRDDSSARNQARDNTD